MKNRAFVDLCERAGESIASAAMCHSLTLIAGTSGRLVKLSFDETIRKARMQVAYRAADDLGFALTTLTEARRWIERAEISDAASVPMNGIFDEIDAAKERIRQAITAHSLEIEAMEIANEGITS